MASIERKISGTFAPVPGGYAQQINEQTTLFVPDFSAARYDPKTGDVVKADIYAPAVLLNEAEFTERTDAQMQESPGCYILALHARK